MPKRSNDFQRLITAIHACISKASVEESALLTDRDTNDEREVDIVLKSKSTDYEIVISIEVNSRSRRADSKWVEEMSGKHQTLPTNKLILVSKAGFYKPAMEKAKARGIEALTIEEACAADWMMALQLVGQRVFQLFNIQFSCSAHMVGKSDWLPAPLSSRITLPGGAHTSVHEIANFVIFNPDVKRAVLDHFVLTKEDEYHARSDVPDGTLFEGSHIIELLINFRLDFKATPVEFVSGRFNGHGIIYGQSIQPNDSLCIVMTKKENGNVEGVIYDPDGFRQLLLNVP